MITPLGAIELRSRGEPTSGLGPKSICLHRDNGRTDQLDNHRTTTELDVCR